MKSRYCYYCQRDTAHVQHRMVSDGIAILAVLLTAGLALIVVAPLVLLDHFQPHRCQVCGKKN